MAEDDEQPPPLATAIFERDFASATRLLGEGRSLDELLEEDGSSPLHEAAREGDAELVAFFLRHGCPRTLAAFDYIAQTPLIAAADHGQVEIARSLLAAGSEVNAHEEAEIGNTAIREATRFGSVELVALLLAAGADPTIPGWMGISAVDQAHFEILTGLESPEAREIQRLFARYPSKVRDGRARG
jgi:ankyrin repeat protein